MNPSATEHEKLKMLMVETFQNEMQSLNDNMKAILADDLVTAFYSRLKVMSKYSQKI